MSTTAIDVRTREEITLAALDYVEGWFDGNAARMERALHPDLAKRTPGQDAVGAGTIETLSADDMIGWTADGLGSRQDPGERRIEIDVHDA